VKIAWGLVLAAVVTVLVVAGVSASGIGLHVSTSSSAGAAQIFGPGKLAYVQNGSLYVLDGTAHTLRRLTRSGKALSPEWSHDGQWLAYVVTNGTNSQVWMSRGDGTSARAVTSTSTYSAGRPPPTR
jgi:hypothetical protein